MGSRRLPGSREAGDDDDEPALSFEAEADDEDMLSENTPLPKARPRSWARHRTKKPFDALTNSRTSVAEKSRSSNSATRLPIGTPTL